MPKNSVYPQSFLIKTLLSDLKSSRTSPVLKPSSFGDSGIQKTIPIAQIGGAYQPASIVNKIHGTGDTYSLYKNFLNIENHKLSSLTPELRIYAIVGKKYRPFYFPVTTDYKFNPDGTFDPSQPYSSNSAVIESFNVSYTAVDHFQAAVGPLRADLTISVDSLSVIFETPDAGYSQLADLFMIRTPEASRLGTGQKRSAAGALKNGQSVGIAVSLRYAMPNTEGLISYAERAAIDSTKQIMELYYETHTITVNANGSATINVSYNGNIAAAKDNSIWDVAQPIAEKEQTVANRAKQSGAYQSSFSLSVPNTKQANKETAKAQDIAEETYSYLEDFIPTISELFKPLFYSQYPKIHNVIYSDSSLQEFFSFADASAGLSGRPAATASAPSNASGKSKASISSKNFTFFEDPNNKNPNDIWRHRYVNYVNFGDLIEAWVAFSTEKTVQRLRGRIAAKEKEKEIKGKDARAQIKLLQENLERISSLNILFSNIVLKPVGSEQSYKVNIADIPISLDLFSRMMYEKYVRTNKKRVQFSEFIEKDALTLLNSSLTALAGAQIIESAKIQTTSMLGVNLKSKIKKGVVKVKDIKLKPDLKKPANNATYMVFFQSNTPHVRAAGRGDLTSDFQNELIHLRPSQDRGLIKTISFSQQEIPGRAETNLAAKGATYEELRIPQDANVELFGNNIFVPGMIVYIDPRSLGLGDPRLADSAGVKIGIGGYYEVVKVSSAYSRGTWTTNLELIFNNYPESDVQPKMTDEMIEAQADAFDMRMTVRKKLVENRK